jgi:GNAT superfamily N-acetyltransferase
MSDKNFEVRAAHAAEVEQIAHCLALAFGPFRAQYTCAAFRDTVLDGEGLRQRMDHMTIYVAVTQEGEIVGTLAAGLSENEGHLRGMAVRPEWQGQQVAQRLLAQAEDDLIAAGCKRLTLDTTYPLQRAIRFYENNGFVYSGTTKDFFGMPLREFVKTLA